jgi:hypothetical protein
MLDAFTLIAILVRAARNATLAAIGSVREWIKALLVGATDDVSGCAATLPANASLERANLVARTAVGLVRQQVSAGGATVLVIGNGASVTVGVAQRAATHALQADLCCTTGLRTTAAVVVGGRGVKTRVIANGLGIAT